MAATWRSTNPQHCRHGRPVQFTSGRSHRLDGAAGRSHAEHRQSRSWSTTCLSFLIYGTTRAEVKGLDQFPRDQWPSPLPLLFYSYHIMAGLGTYFVALMLLEVFLLWRGKLFETRWALWPLLLSFPLPYIANTAGWMTAEIGRQPWLVYGLIRTSDGYSKNVSAGNTLFTLLGFMGMYTVLSILFIILVYRTVGEGPSTGRSAS